MHTLARTCYNLVHILLFDVKFQVLCSMFAFSHIDGLTIRNNMSCLCIYTVLNTVFSQLVGLTSNWSLDLRKAITTATFPNKRVSQPGRVSHDVNWGNSNSFLRDVYGLEPFKAHLHKHTGRPFLFPITVFLLSTLFCAASVLSCLQSQAPLCLVIILTDCTVNIQLGRTSCPHRRLYYLIKI